MRCYSTMRIVISLLCFALFLASCGDSASQKGQIKKVVATTGMVGDATSRLLGDLAEVEVLMGPGVDPHLYKASQGDMQKLNDAGMVVYSGHHLEGKMADILQKLGRQKPVFPMAEYIAENRLQHGRDGNSAIDPHLWMEPKSWIMGIEALADTLKALFPNDTQAIGSNFRSYRDEIIQANDSIDRWMHEIPVAQRVLITSHDAFQYFGLAYQVEVKGLQGISTVSEYGLKDVSDMVNFIVNRKIPAVFVESSVSDKSLQAVLEGCRSKGHPLKIGGTLFSDALGAKGTPEGTYTGMLLYNARTIKQALK